MDSMSYWFLRRCVQTFRLGYPTLFQLAILLLSPIKRSSYCWQSLFSHVPYYMLPFNFLTDVLASCGYIASFAPGTVLFVVFEHRYIFFGCCYPSFFQLL